MDKLPSFENLSHAQKQRPGESAPVWIARLLSEHPDLMSSQVAAQVQEHLAHGRTVYSLQQEQIEERSAP